MHRECRERFPPHLLKRKPLVSYPGMHHGTYVTAIWQKAHGLSDSGHARAVMQADIANPREKRSRFSQGMRNPQFNVFDKRPIPHTTFRLMSKIKLGEDHLIIQKYIALVHSR